jgi:hypothetical protein
LSGLLSIEGKNLFSSISMNSLLVSAIIGVIYVVVKMVLNYKESPSPNIKEGILVMLSSMAGLYGTSQFGMVKPKVTEVFTETPGF